MELSIPLSGLERVTLDVRLDLIARAVACAIVVHGSSFRQQFHAPRIHADRLVVPLGALEHVFESLSQARAELSSEEDAGVVLSLSDRVMAEAVERGWLA